MPDPDSAASLLAPGPAADPDPVARHAAELRSRVAEHLTAGETVRAAVWVTRAPGRPVARAAGATPAPALEALPVPAGGAVPARAGEAIPAPTGEAIPAPTGEAIPAPTGEAMPARAGEAAPTRAVGASRVPAGEAVPAGPVEAAEADRRGVLHGDPQSNAAHLDRHVPAPPAARVLALTGDRLIALAPPAPDRGGRLTAGLRAVRELLRSGPAPAGTPPLTPLWECPRGALATASEHDGRLHLVFADGSGLILLTPAELARPFVRAAS